MENDKHQLVEELKALLEQDVTTNKEQVDQLKTQFYRQYHQELEQLRQAAEQASQESEQEEPELWQPPVDEDEVQFRELLAQYKQKRAEAAAKVAAEQEQNLLRKQTILDEMKKLAEADCGDAMANLKRMRELQADWKTIGAVPAPKVQELWKQYQQYQEQFYDMVKINIELRDLDFKKNLELKTLLCEAAEKLQEQESVVEASRALQQLHDEWAEIGPVARELREDLWNRFKAASTVINKKHQAYFDEIHRKEQENLEKKQAIIDRLKAVDYSNVQSSKTWDELTEQVHAMQTEWRTIGFAPKKQNQAIYEEYRALCDAFFQAKTAYYKGLRDELNLNLQKKRSIIERAEALKDSTEWKETTDKLIELQQEWKTVGPVARKYSDELWQKFNEVCDTFFNAKREAFKDERLKAKGERAARAVKAAASQGAEGLRRMRDRLQQEIKTAENNILFFSGKSKTANKLVEDMQKKIDQLKKQLDEIEQKMDNE
jgi:hypothetical protein